MDSTSSHQFDSYTDRFLRLNEDLLPGIPNEVTLERLATKLNWRVFLILSSVNRVWQQAIRNCLVYDTRVHSGSTETLVVLNHSGSDDNYGIGIYSLTDKALYPLPPIAQIGNRFPPHHNIISLDGKIYVLGGFRQRKRPLTRTFRHLESLRIQEENGQSLYVLDLAGGRGQWKQCASMKKARRKAGCGIKGRKIYVFGGESGDTVTVHGSEVYDPTADAWSQIAHNSSLRCYHDVTTVGEELFVYGGESYALFWPNPVHGLRAYHPVNDKWRTLSKILVRRHHNSRKFFMAQGNLYSMTKYCIYAHDFGRNRESQFHSFSFDEGTFGSVSQAPAVLAVGDELLAILFTWGYARDQSWAGCEGSQAHWHTYLMQSKGFGGKDKEIVWEKLPCSFSCKRECIRVRDPFMVSLQL